MKRTHRSYGCLSLDKERGRQVANRFFGVSLCLASMLTSTAVAAGTSSAQLIIGVTVSRSCAVDTQPAAPTSSRVRLACTSGAARSLQMNGVSRIGGMDRTADVLAPTAPYSPFQSQSDLRVVTVNF